MSAENECIVYIGGIKKIEVIARENLSRVVNNLPATDVYASISLKAGKAFDNLNFITETALLKIKSELSGSGLLHIAEVVADLTGMETFATTHKLLFGKWVVKITDNRDVIWILGSENHGGRFSKAIDSKINGGNQSGTVLSYLLKSAYPILKNK